MSFHIIKQHSDASKVNTGDASFWILMKGVRKRPPGGAAGWGMMILSRPPHCTNVVLQREVNRDICLEIVLEMKLFPHNLCVCHIQGVY